MGLIFRALRSTAGLFLGAVALTSATFGDGTTSGRPVDESRIYVYDANPNASLLAFNPKTGDHEVAVIGHCQRSRVSPNGKFFAFEKENAIWVTSLLKEGEPKQVLKLEGAAFGSPPIWSSDGFQLIISRGTRDQLKNAWVFRSFKVNADGTNPTELKIPPEDGVQGWSADGKWLLTASSRNAKIGWQLYMMRTDGTEPKQITEGGNPFYTRLSPDGKSVVYTDGTSEERRGIWIVDLPTLKRRRIVATGKDHVSACWSPDGKRIAVISFERATGQGDPVTEGTLIMVDPDGLNRVEIPLKDVHGSDMPDWQ